MMTLLLSFFIFCIFGLVLIIPSNKKVFYIGTSIAAVVISFPLLRYQSLDPRPGLYWYPVFLVLLALLVAWGLTHVSGLASRPDSEPELYQIIFVAVACFSAGFFISWFAAIGTYLRGGWRGVILNVNALTAVVGLLGGFWSAIAVRLKNPLTTITTNLVLLVTAGCIVIQFLWVVIQPANSIPAIWTILAILKASSPDNVITPPGVIAYFLLEAFAGQVVWPLALLICVYAVYSAK